MRIFRFVPLAVLAFASIAACSAAPDEPTDTTAESVTTPTRGATESSLIITMADSIKTMDCSKMCEIFDSITDVVKLAQCKALCITTNQNAGEPLGANYRLKLRSKITVQCQGSTLVSATGSTDCKVASETLAGIEIGKGESSGCYNSVDGKGGKISAYIGGHPPLHLERGLQTLGERDCSIIWMQTEATFGCNADGKAEWKDKPKYSSSSFPSAAWVLASPDAGKQPLTKNYEQQDFWALYSCDGDKVSGGTR